MMIVAELGGGYGFLGCRSRAGMAGDTENFVDQFGRDRHCSESLGRDRRCRWGRRDERRESWRAKQLA